MRPLPFVWPYWIVFWGTFLLSFFIESRIVSRAVRSERANRSQDAGSVYVVMLLGNISSILAFVAAFRLPAAAIHARVAAFWFGIALIIAGALLRRHCFRMLGEHFTGVVQVRPDQPVVDRGAYHWVRHPSYTAGLIMFVGIAFALGNWASVAFVTISFIAYWYRVTVEERAMLATIGEPYRAYMQRTKRFVPYVF